VRNVKEGITLPQKIKENTQIESLIRNFAPFAKNIQHIRKPDNNKI